jgi:hypothetical protein
MTLPPTSKWREKISLQLYSGSSSPSLKNGKRKGYAAAIGMKIVRVTTFLSLQGEPLGLKRPDQMTSGDRAQAGIVHHYTFTATIGS